MPWFLEVRDCAIAHKVIVERTFGQKTMPVLIEESKRKPSTKNMVN